MFNFDDIKIGDYVSLGDDIIRKVLDKRICYNKTKYIVIADDEYGTSDIDVKLIINHYKKEDIENCNLPNDYKKNICPICKKEIDLTKEPAMYYPDSFELCHLWCIFEIVNKHFEKVEYIDEENGWKKRDEEK